MNYEPLRELATVQFLYNKINEENTTKIEDEINKLKTEIELLQLQVATNEISIDEANKRIDNTLIQIGTLQQRIKTLEDKFSKADLDKITKWIDELESLGLNPEELGKQYDYYLDLQDIRMLFKSTTELLEMEDDPYDLGMLEFETTAVNDLLQQGDKLISNGFNFTTNQLIWQTNRRVQGGIIQIDIHGTKELNNQDGVIYLNLNNVIQFTIKEDLINEKYIYTVEQRPEISGTGTLFTASIDMDLVKNTRNNYQFTNQDVHILRFNYETPTDMYQITGIQITIDISKPDMNVNYTYYDLFKLPGTLFSDFLLNLPYGISINSTLNKSTDNDISSFSQILRVYSILRLGDLIDVVYDTTEDDLKENKLFGLYGISAIVSISTLADTVSGTVHATNSDYSLITSWVGDLHTYPETLPNFEFGNYLNKLPFADNYPFPQFYQPTTVYECGGKDTYATPARCDSELLIEQRQVERSVFPWLKFLPSQIQNIRFANVGGGALSTEYNIPNTRLLLTKGTLRKMQDDSGGTTLDVDYFMERSITNFTAEKTHGPVTIVLRGSDGFVRIIDVDKTRSGLIASGALNAGYKSNIDSYAYCVVGEGQSEDDWTLLRKEETQIDIVFGVVVEATVTYDDNLIIDTGNVTNDGALGEFTGQVVYTINNGDTQTKDLKITKQKLLFGQTERVCYISPVETTTSEENIIISGRVIRLKSRYSDVKVRKPENSAVGFDDTQQTWVEDVLPNYTCNTVRNRGGDAVKFNISPLTRYMICRIGTDDKGSGQPIDVSMLPSERGGKQPLLYFSNFSTSGYSEMIHDYQGTSSIKQGYFTFSSGTLPVIGWQQCPGQEDNLRYFRWGRRWRTSRVDPLRVTSGDDLVITISLDQRIYTEMYYVTEDTPDKLIGNPFPSKISGVTRAKIGPYKIQEDYDNNEMMEWYMYTYTITPGNDIVDGSSPLTLINYGLTNYKVQDVKLSVKTEIVLPDKVISQTELAEDSVRQWNSIDLIRQYTAYLNILLNNQAQRISYVEESIKIINDRINTIVAQLSPKENPFGIAKLLTNFLGTTVGLFFPLTGLLFQIATTLIDTVEHIQNEDILYGALDILLFSALTALGIKKFQNRLDEKYGAIEIDRAVDRELIKLKNSFLKLGQTVKTQFSKVGTSLSKLRWKSPGYNPFGSSAKYTINSRPQRKLFSFWTRTTNIKYTKLTNEPEIEVDTAIHSPGTNRNGKLANWLKERDADWKNILDKTVKNGRVNAPVFRGNLKHKVLAKNGDAVVTKLGNEGYLVYKINGKIRKYPIDVDTKVSDFTLIKDPNMTMNDWIELMHLYSGLGRSSAVVSLDDEIMDALILSARRTVRPDSEAVYNNVATFTCTQYGCVYDDVKENTVENLPSVSYEDVIKVLDVGIQSRLCLTNVISALLAPDSSDIE